MPRVPDLLHRFLPAGAPGAAGVAGVPTDRVADETAELAPLFAQLAATETECDEIAQQAQRDASAAHERSVEEIRGIVARAQQRAGSERADALARAAQAMQAQTEAELAAANEQAMQLRARAVEHVPAFVARVAVTISDLIAPARTADAA